MLTKILLLLFFVCCGFYPEDDDADDCDEHCEAGLISFDQIESHLNGSRGEQVENSFLLKRDHTGKIHFN